MRSGRQTATKGAEKNSTGSVAAPVAAVALGALRTTPLLLVLLMLAAGAASSSWQGVGGGRIVPMVSALTFSPTSVLPRIPARTTKSRTTATDAGARYHRGGRWTIKKRGVPPIVSLRAGEREEVGGEEVDDGSGGVEASPPPSVVSLSADGETDAAASKMLSTEPQVFPQRWVQLGYLSILALLSDWICFSVAATPDTYEAAFQHSAASLIDMFLFTNVASSFVVTDVVKKIGLQRAVQGAAVLMALGCWLRSGISFLPMIEGAEHLMSYPLVLVGTLFVGCVLDRQSFLVFNFCTIV